MFIKITKFTHTEQWYSDFVNGVFYADYPTQSTFVVLHNGKRHIVHKAHCVECDINGKEIFETESYFENPLNRSFTFCYIDGNTVKNKTVVASSFLAACEKTDFVVESVFSIIRQ